MELIKAPMSGFKLVLSLSPALGQTQSVFRDHSLSPHRSERKKTSATIRSELAEGRRVKQYLLTAVVTLMPVEASAVVRYLVQNMTCAEVQDSVTRDGVAILYRKAAQSGTPLYDRYEANETFWPSGQNAIKEGVPTADTTACRVSKCVEPKPLWRQQQVS
jgi:hypothetical protein